MTKTQQKSTHFEWCRSKNNTRRGMGMSLGEEGVHILAMQGTTNWFYPLPSTQEKKHHIYDSKRQKNRPNIQEQY